MWHAIGIVLVGAMGQVAAAVEANQGGPPSVPVEAWGGPVGSGVPGFQSGLMPGEQPVHPAEIAAAGCETCGYGTGCSYMRPCFFDSYWDFTGSRSPTEYACWDGYGPDWCNTWNARVEWLLWFTDTRDTPLLVRTFNGIAADGSLINPQTIAGEQPIGDGTRNGARITLGRYLGDSNVRVEGRFWGLEDGSDRFIVTSEDNARFAIPLINATNGLPLSYLVSFPGVAANGGVEALAKNDFIGADAWLRQTWWDDGAFHFDVLAGYQFTRMDDSLRLRTERTLVAAPTTRSRTQDLFVTNNEFHGASIGLVAEFRKKAVSFEVLGKLALGNMRERVFIDGRSDITPTPGGGNPDGGILAQPSNEGEYIFNRFTVVPELNINFVVHLSPAWRVLAGYSLLYLNEAMLAGDQIDRRVNPNFILNQPGGPALPAFLNVDTTFFVQGMSLGLDYRW